MNKGFKDLSSLYLKDNPNGHIDGLLVEFSIVIDEGLKLFEKNTYNKKFLCFVKNIRDYISDLISELYKFKNRKERYFFVKDKLETLIIEIDEHTFIFSESYLFVFFLIELKNNIEFIIKNMMW